MRSFAFVSYLTAGNQIAAHTLTATISANESGTHIAGRTAACILRCTIRIGIISRTCSKISLPLPHQAIHSSTVFGIVRAHAAGS